MENKKFIEIPERDESIKQVEGVENEEEKKCIEMLDANNKEKGSYEGD